MATAVHEAVHLRQFEYGFPFDDGWADEMIATAMEFLILQDNRDYHRYLERVVHASSRIHRHGGQRGL